MPPPKPAYDVDWIFSNNSDVHVANHRDWFTSYTSFPTKTITPFGDEMAVEGIGNVQLPTHIRPTNSGVPGEGTVILRDVLFAPGAACNIIGYPIVYEYKLKTNFGNGSGSLRSKTDGRLVGLFNMNKLIRLRLRGQSSTQTSLDLQKHFYIRANWSPSERAKWLSFACGRGNQGPGNHYDNTNEDLPLTKDEKKWLKDNYGGEFHFLRQHELSIYEEGDRAEGRSILRAFMQKDGPDDAEESGRSTEDSASDSDA